MKRNWGLQMAAGLAALLATFGILLAMAGFAGLLGNYQALADLNANRPLAAVFTALGLLMLYVGVRAWRRCRVRMRHGRDLHLAPGLTKKRD